MVLTIDSPFHCGTEITENQFVDVLRKRGALTLGNPLWNGFAEPEIAARQVYQAIVATPQESAEVWLMIAQKEHSTGTNKDSVLHRNDTRNWFNTRSVRLPGLTQDPADKPRRKGHYRLISDAKRDGVYVSYFDIIDAIKDAIYRIDDPSYVYREKRAASIIEVIQIAAPKSDGNDPVAYANTIATGVNEMRAYYAKEPAVAGDDSRFQWIPDTSEFGYPKGAPGRGGRPIDFLIIHITAGTDSLSWLNGNNGSSAHYLTDRQMRPRAQMISERDAAWTAGNSEWNLRGINVEFEKPASERWTVAQIKQAAVTVYPILKRNGIPLVYLGRGSAPGIKGIIGHSDVPDPLEPGKWGGAENHTDPGASFDWNLFIAELNRLDDESDAPVQQETIERNGYTITGGILQNWKYYGGVEVWGEPVSNEIRGAEAEARGAVVIQKFERGWVEWAPKRWPDRWDCTWARLGVEYDQALKRIAELEEENRGLREDLAEMHLGSEDEREASD